MMNPPSKEPTCGLDLRKKLVRMPRPTVNPNEMIRLNTLDSTPKDMLLLKKFGRNYMESVVLSC